MNQLGWFLLKFKVKRKVSQFNLNNDNDNDVVSTSKKRLWVASKFSLILSLILSLITITACQQPTDANHVDSTSSSKEQLLKESLAETGQTEPEPAEPIKKLKANTSQQFIGDNDIEARLRRALPEITYSTHELPERAIKVNNEKWLPEQELTNDMVIKMQALLNWHNHGVGAVDGMFAKNTRKALQTFQKANGLEPTGAMNEETWTALTADEALNKQPVFVTYTLTDDDVNIWYDKPKNMQYKTRLEKVAEKFHMSRQLLKEMNPDLSLKAGKTITVYNPGQPNLTAVEHVEVYKKQNLLIAYDKDKNIIASYPTSIGKATPSNQLTVTSKILQPTYNSDFSTTEGLLPPGPNNPVGMVWMGLSKPTFGIHGSPDPEHISRQQSQGCVRLTNWDALAMFGTLQEGATVEFH